MSLTLQDAHDLMFKDIDGYVGTTIRLQEQRDELLEALQGLLNCISETRGQSSYNAEQKARAVIEKATNHGN